MQLAQLFKITNKKYPYLIPIIQELIILKQPLNDFLRGNEQEKKAIKRKIRKDFYKIKQELGLINYMFDDLRFCQKCAKHDEKSCQKCAKHDEKSCKKCATCDIINL